MTKASSSQVNLGKVFGAVTEVLKENQQSLNAADEYNHNHGDNMVESFQVITKAVRAKRKAPPAEQLAAARDRLRQRPQSGSAQLYSQGLEQAADRLKDKGAINQQDALLLVQALMGGQTTQAPQSQTSAEDPIGSLLGALMGGQNTQAPQSQTPAEDPIGSLLGALMGGQNTQAPQSQTTAEDPIGGLLGALMGGATAQPTQAAQPEAKPDKNEAMVNMLVAAGTTFLQARQQGAEPTAALVQAVLAGSQMQSSSHRQQSGQLVAQTLINTLGSMLSGKK